jgi:UDP-2,3-diacylglucosamine pyrophosphatase LpxH
MAKPIVLIADVHLSPGVTACRLFDFLDSLKGEGKRLIVLGDLLEFWIGPKHLRTGDYDSLLDALRRYVSAGGTVEVLPGNRDFLLDGAFEKSSGSKLIPETTDIRSGPLKVRLTHGDLLSPFKLPYRILRILMHNAFLRWGFVRLPVCISRGIALAMRGWSRNNAAKRHPCTPVLSERAVRAFLDGTDVLVAGHQHGRLVKEYPAQGPPRAGASEAQPKSVYVLARFDETGHYLELVDGRIGEGWFE